MGKVRVSVEWAFRDICVNFAFVDLKKQTKSVSAATRAAISSSSSFDKLPYLSVWESNLQVF